MNSESESNPIQLDEEVREFIVECNENIVNLDQEIVQLEQGPSDAKLTASIFRTFHTIKGTCGFFDFKTLGSIAHVAENLLDQVRGGKRDVDSRLAALLLESVDAIKAVIATIETTGGEGEEEYAALRERLTQTLDLSESEKDSAVRADAVQRSAAPTASPVPISHVSPSQPEPLLHQQTTTAVEAEQISALVDSTIRVDVGLLDKLMNLVGELVLARNQLLQGTVGQDGSVIRTVQRLNVVTSELQQGVLKTRMQPIGVVWNKLPRVTRDLAAACGKKIRLEMEGAETELDKTIIEAIKDPLTHIVRNACDHGVEGPEERLAAGKQAEGLVTLRAYHEGGHVNIEICDDGRGLDVEKLKSRAVEKGVLRAEEAAQMTRREALHLVFAAGFSTAEKITTISGRGIGMDVVKTNIQKIGGVVDINNRTGAAGSVVKIKIPLTLAIIPGLLIQASSAGDVHRFVIPQANLLELIRLDREEEKQQVEYVNGVPVYRRRGQLLPLTYLNRVLGMAGTDFPDESQAVNIVVLQAEDRPFGLVVDGISDTQEIVVKPLGKRLKGLSSYAGATIMGDGRVALILDVPGLARLAGIVSQSREVRKQDLVGPPADAKHAFLIFRAGSFDRLAVPLASVSRLEQVDTAKIQRASGQRVLHYRNEILPLRVLSEVLDGTAVKELRGMVQVVVLGEGAQRTGIIVDQIVDIVEEGVTYRQEASHAGLECSVILGGTITDLIDIQGLLKDQPTAADEHRDPVEVA